MSREIAQQLRVLADQLDPPGASGGEADGLTFVDGKTAPDELGRVRLEFIERELVPKFGAVIHFETQQPTFVERKDLPIPRLWYVKDVDVSGLDDRGQKHYNLNVGQPWETPRNQALFYEPGVFTYFGIPWNRAGEQPNVGKWNGTLAELRLALIGRISLLKAGHHGHWHYLGDD